MPVVPCRTSHPSCRTHVRQSRHGGQPPWLPGPAPGPATPCAPGVTRAAAAGPGPAAEARGDAWGLDAWGLDCLACLPHLASLEVDLVPAVQGPAGRTHAADKVHKHDTPHTRGHQRAHQQHRRQQQRQEQRQQQREAQLGLALGQAQLLEGLGRLTALRSLSLSLLDLPPAVLAAAAAAASAAAATAAARAAATAPCASGAATAGGAAAAAPSGQPRPAVRRRFEGVGRPGAQRGGGGGGQDRGSSGGGGGEAREARGELGRTLGALGWVHAGEVTVGTAGGGVETAQAAKPSSDRDSDGGTHGVPCTAVGYDSDGAIEYGSDLDLGTEEAEEPDQADKGEGWGKGGGEGQEGGVEEREAAGERGASGSCSNEARAAYGQCGASGEREASGGGATELELEEAGRGPKGRPAGSGKVDAGLEHGRNVSSTGATLAESATALGPLATEVLAEDEDSSVSSYNGDERDGGQGEERRDGGNVGSGEEGGNRGGPPAAAEGERVGGRDGGHDSESSGGGGDDGPPAASLRVWTPQPAVFAGMVHLQVRKDASASPRSDRCRVVPANDDSHARASAQHLRSLGLRHPVYASC